MHLDNFISYFDNICSVKPLVTSFLIIGIVNFSSVFTNILVECQRVQTMTSQHWRIYLLVPRPLLRLSYQLMQGQFRCHFNFFKSIPCEHKVSSFHVQFDRLHFMFCIIMLLFTFLKIGDSQFKLFPREKGKS